MAKMFYTVEEAASRLSVTEEEVKGLVRAGKLREFRDAGTFNYKVEDVDALAGPPAPDDGGDTDVVGGSSAEDIVLEPAEDSSIELAASGSDVLSASSISVSTLGKLQKT